MKLFIKNMVCPRCISTVESLLDKTKIAYKSVILGEADLLKPLSAKKRKELETALKAVGFELIDNRMSVLVDKIKKAVMTYISLPERTRRLNLSTFIASEVNYEYTYISNLFSSIEGMTIEQFYILQR